MSSDSPIIIIPAAEAASLAAQRPLSAAGADWAEAEARRLLRAMQPRKSSSWPTFKAPERLAAARAILRQLLAIPAAAAVSIACDTSRGQASARCSHQVTGFLLYAGLIDSVPTERGRPTAYRLTAAGRDWAAPALTA